jgi:ferredoxin
VNTILRPRWDQRRFVSLCALFSGLALPITGIADHVARDSSGVEAGAGWIVAHVAIGAVFVVFAAWHAVLNRRALLRYLRARAARPSLPSREPLAAPAMARVAGDSPPTRRARRIASQFIALDRSRCEACWECVAVCPEAVIGKIEMWHHRHAVIGAGDRCGGCRRCVKVCPTGALSVREG